jgi:ribose-phosphate pyrophosphokinase
MSAALTLDLTRQQGCVFTVFPDGQPHCKLDEAAFAASGYTHIDVNTCLRSAQDVVHACLAIDAARGLLRSAGKQVPIHLNIGYMLGARMDRPIAPGQPATLHVLSALLNSANADQVRVLDPHSPVTLQTLQHCTALHPDLFIGEVLQRIAQEHGTAPVVIIPDKGAVARTNGILARIGGVHATASCSKVRNPNTGKLSGFALESGEVRGRKCLIVDDICDGGGTFSGVAKVLLEAGATSVELAVTHGIFSKGLRIEHIDCLYSTDSYGLPTTKQDIAQTAGAAAVQLLTYNDVATGRALAHIWTNMLTRAVSAIQQT